MKKILSLILCCAFVLSFCACEKMDPNYGKSSQKVETKQDEAQPQTVSLPEIKSDDEVMPTYFDISLYDEENYADIYLGKDFEYKITYGGSNITVPASYKNMIKTHSARWIELPFNASAEQIARVLFALISKALSLTTMQNGENGVFLEYVKLNETAKGWACFEKADFESLGVDIASIICSRAVSSESADIISRLSKNEKFINPKEL